MVPISPLSRKLIMSSAISKANNNSSTLDGADVHYILPSDASETERLRLNHSMWKFALGA
jgi:hypothetical protein